MTPEAEVAKKRVLEVYPDKTLFVSYFPITACWKVYFEVTDSQIMGHDEDIGFGDSEDAAWIDAASRLPADEVAQKCQWCNAAIKFNEDWWLNKEGDNYCEKSPGFHHEPEPEVRAKQCQHESTYSVREYVLDNNQPFGRTTASYVKCHACHQIVEPTPSPPAQAIEIPARPKITDYRNAQFMVMAFTRKLGEYADALEQRIEQQEETIRRLTGSLRIIKNCSKDRDAAVEAEMGLAGDSVNGMDQRRE